MMTITPRTTAILAMVSGLFAAMPARAETSAITDAFVAATLPAYVALQRADDLALTEERGARVKSFARHDSESQANAAEALAAWQQAQRQADYAAAQTPSLDGLGPILYPFSSVVLPFNVHGRAETEPYRVALAQLSALGGAEFDALYVARQSSTLRRLVDVYTDYIKNGDDPGLRLLAVRNLPRVKQLLAELART